MSMLDPRLYMQNIDTSLVPASKGGIIDTSKLSDINFSGTLLATGSPVGVIHVWMTDDPNAAYDVIRANAVPAASSSVVWIPVTIPAGSYHGTGIAVAGANVTLTGAASFALDLKTPMAFMYLDYLRTSGGAVNTLNVWRAGRGARS